MKIKEHLGRQKFLTFCVATLVFSWSCWLPVLGGIRSNLFESSLGTLTGFFAGAYGPSFCAVLLSFFFEGRHGLKRLFQRRLEGAAALKWSAAVLLVGPLVYAGAIALFESLGGGLGAPNYGVLPWIPIIFLVSLFLGPLAEELGWRGYALPQLQLDARFLRANLTLGLLWALWHAPLFWAATGTAISGMPVSVSSVALFAVAVLGSTFVYSWAYQRTKGSVFIAILLHLSLNSCGTVSSWLFPEMEAAQKPLMYLAYVMSLWLFVGVLYIAIRFGPSERARAEGVP